MWKESCVHLSECVQSILYLCLIFYDFTYTFRSISCCKYLQMKSDSTFFSSPLTNLVVCVPTKGMTVNNWSNLIKWCCNIAKFTLWILMKLNLSQTIIFMHYFDKIIQLEWTELSCPFDKRFNGLASSTFCPQKFILQESEGASNIGETLVFLTNSLLKATHLTCHRAVSENNNLRRNRKQMT